MKNNNYIRCEINAKNEPYKRRNIFYCEIFYFIRFIFLNVLTRSWRKPDINWKCFRPVLRWNIRRGNSSDSDHQNNNVSHWPLGASVRSAPNQLTDILMWTSAGHWRLRLLLRCLFFSQEVDSKLHVMPFTVNVLFSALLQEVTKNSGEHKASSSVFWIVDQQHHDWLSSLKQTPDVWAITGPRGQVLKC